MDEVQKQRDYYRRTASAYDKTFMFDSNDEHYIAAALLSGIFDHYQVSNFLDVGCGTGRALCYLRERHPNVEMFGVEPVDELRMQAESKGLCRKNLFCGDACELDMPDGQYDCVSLFGVLHHIPRPELAIREAMRVSRKLVYVSDHNVYGMGSWLTKMVKQCLRDLGLRKLLNYLLTHGKGYHDTDFDGIFYPFSLVDYFNEFLKGSHSVYTFCTKTPAINLYRDASHFAVLAVKD